MISCTNKFLVLVLCCSSPLTVALGQEQNLNLETATRLTNLALSCLHQEYPNKISHILGSDADVHPPRVLTPAFYGCFDWHSSVHGHWLPRAQTIDDIEALLPHNL